MWADAQHDGRPAKYRWRLLLNGCQSTRHMTNLSQSTRHTANSSHGQLVTIRHTSKIFFKKWKNRPVSYVTSWLCDELTGSMLNAAKFSWRPLLECRAVTLPIYENARLGRKVNFARGKIPLGGKTPKMYTIFQPMDGQTSCKVCLTSLTSVQ